MEQISLAVRALVEFSCPPADIQRLGRTLKNMQEGTLGHQARQKLLGEGWQSEVPLRLSLPLEDEDAELLLNGRMDAFFPGDGNTPIVEEIKLSSGQQAPTAAAPAHALQALCYGHMLCKTTDMPRITLRVAYVNRRGKVQAQFEETLSAEEIQERFSALLAPYVRRLKQLRAHRRARDASLRALRFPFPQYRAGQREMAAQAYTALRRQKRLFASMPTGTGKSAAALFPALKALGEGLTEQVYYLTARTTQRQGPLEALRLMRRQPLTLWVLTLDAKEKQCPLHAPCSPETCPRAQGHFLRAKDAMEEMLRTADWSPQFIRQVADAHQICPFEFSLALCEIADVTICDYNYALDPAVHIQRIFDHPVGVTLLIDEAHNLLPRVREMLSGQVDGGRLRKLRTAVGKCAGRKHPLYQALTAVLRALTDLPLPEDAEEGTLSSFPQSLDRACADLADAFLDTQQEPIAWGDSGPLVSETLTDLLAFNRARRREGTPYAWLWQGHRTCRVTALALDVAPYLQQVTAPLCGVVCFSATMDPLEDMKALLGGGEEDACFAVPSPFPPENLFIAQSDIDLRYRRRADSVDSVAEALRAMVTAKPGRYIAFFPSFAYLRQVAERLDLPFQAQSPRMTDEERQAFLSPYLTGNQPVLSLCVLGGVFAEGIDLPGTALDGVAVAGVGLPQVGLAQETLRAYYQEKFGNGFFYAYMLPGMQKVAQAVGRVIRTETDVGVALLLDDRYRQADYRRLCPPHWQIRRGDAAALLARFWRSHICTPTDADI